MRLLRCLLLPALYLASGLVAAAELEIVTLKYRSAEQVIPVIRPLLAPGGEVSGMQNQLILRTTRSNLAELRKVLASVDTLPRRLMIHVRQDAEDARAQSGGYIAAGGDGTQGPVGATAKIYESRGASAERISQQLQVLEGNQAYIQVGRSIPVTARTLTRTVNGMAVTESTAYRDLESGFTVVPRVVGERVYLDISPRRDTPVGKRGGADVERMHTRAGGRMGEWFELGGSTRDASRADSGVLIGAAGMRKDRHRVWVKVEELK